MLRFFRRTALPADAPPATQAAAAASPSKGALQNGLLLPASPHALLATPQRQGLLAQIWQHTAVSRAQFQRLYQTPIERYAALVQQFPASEAHHHAYHGGMLDHGLEIVLYALKLRQSHLLPVGVPPEDQAAQSEAWTAAIAYAALTHDIGKIAVDLEVETADGQVWHPWHGPLSQAYRFRYRIGREHRLHEAAAGLLYHRLLDADVLDWLCGYPELWAALLHALAGQYEHAGLLGELVIQADQASVANALGGDPAKALAAPRHALKRKLLDGLRFLLNKELKLNQPQASDGWLTQDTLWLVSKTVSDKLRAHLLSQGMDGIPSNNTAVFNVLQEHGIAQPTPDGKAIWKATVTSDTGWTHGFTLLRLTPALIWGQDERPAAFAGTVVDESGSGDTENVTIATSGAEAGASAENAGAVVVDTVAGNIGADRHEQADALENAAIPAPGDDVMDSLMQMIGVGVSVDEANGSAAATEPETVDNATADQVTKKAIEDGQMADTIPDGTTTTTGQDFISWLRMAILTRKVLLNDAKALVHAVDDTIFLVSPGIFMRYAQEHPHLTAQARAQEMPDWQWVQKQFEKSRLHRKQPDGLNIWTCEVSGPRKSRRLHGYLLQSFSPILDSPIPNNPFLSIRSKNSAKEVTDIHLVSPNE